MAAKYFLTFYPGANEAAVVFGTSVGGWKKTLTIIWVFPIGGKSPKWRVYSGTSY